MIIRIATALITTALSYRYAPAAAETVQFDSATYQDFRQLLTGQAPTDQVSITARLEFPDQAKDRYPAVVIVQTLGGYLDANEGWHAAVLRKAGFATLTYDGFVSRGTTGAAWSRQGQGWWPSGVSDAYAALRLLATHPKIDARRIGIMGFSYGGEVAHLAALATLKAAFSPDGAGFAAHVAYYPAGIFGAVAGSTAYTGAPVLMLLGDSDDNLPLAKVDSYLSYAQAAGHPSPIETVIYPGAYHAWTVSTLGAPRFYPQYGSAKKCPLILLGPERPELLVAGHSAPLDPAALQTCRSEAPGYTMGFNDAARAKAVTDAVAFLVKHLQTAP
jgi:dienelactone hydrolase